MNLAAPIAAKLKHLEQRTANLSGLMRNYDMIIWTRVDVRQKRYIKIFEIDVITERRYSRIKSYLNIQ